MGTNAMKFVGFSFKCMSRKYFWSRNWFHSSERRIWGSKCALQNEKWLPFAQEPHILGQMELPILIKRHQNRQKDIIIFIIRSFIAYAIWNWFEFRNWNIAYSLPFSVVIIIPVISIIFRLLSIIFLTHYSLFFGHVIYIFHSVHLTNRSEQAFERHIVR